MWENWEQMRQKKVFQGHIASIETGRLSRNLPEALGQEVKKKTVYAHSKNIDSLLGFKIRVGRCGRH